MNIKKDCILSFEIYYKMIEIHDNKIISRIPCARINEIVTIVDNNYNEVMKAEVVRIENNDIVCLIPFLAVSNLSQEYLIRKSGLDNLIKIGLFLKGKMLNGFGEIIASLHHSNGISDANFDLINYNVPEVPNPLNRRIINTQFITRVKAIDLLIPCGFGQRFLVCAQAGVGKTTLISMVANTSKAIVIINLIGERGREVNEFLNLLDDEIKKNSIFIVSTSNSSNFEKVKSFYLSHSIAAWLRGKNYNVLLIVDSVTRFARALREISLSTGSIEVRGYTSTVFNVLPCILESCGTIDKDGSVTAFYTALFEDDNINSDPLIEELKSITDGHIVLSRKIANNNRYPAIDFLASISRIQHQIISKNHREIINRILFVYNKYSEIELMLKIGEYTEGGNKEIDEIIILYEKLNIFFNQKSLADYHDISVLLKDVSEVLVIPPKATI